MKRKSHQRSSNTDITLIASISLPLDGSSPSSAMDQNTPSPKMSSKTSPSKSSLSPSTTNGTTIGINRKKPIQRIRFINPSRILLEVTLYLCRGLYRWNHYGLSRLSIHNHHSSIYLLRRSLSGRRKEARMVFVLPFGHTIRQILSLFLRCSRNLLFESCRDLNGKFCVNRNGQ